MLCSVGIWMYLWFSWYKIAYRYGGASCRYSRTCIPFIIFMSKKYAKQKIKIWKMMRSQLLPKFSVESNALQYTKTACLLFWLRFSAAPKLRKLVLSINEQISEYAKINFINSLCCSIIHSISTQLLHSGVQTKFFSLELPVQCETSRYM